jgi:hypothetical protein
MDTIKELKDWLRNIPDNYWLYVSEHRGDYTIFAQHPDIHEDEVFKFYGHYDPES